jgi:hypothetical protein
MRWLYSRTLPKNSFQHKVHEGNLKGALDGLEPLREQDFKFLNVVRDIGLFAVESLQTPRIARTGGDKISGKSHHYQTLKVFDSNQTFICNQTLVVRAFPFQTKPLGSYFLEAGYDT